MEMIKNRLVKNLKRRQKWAKKNNIDAYRIYERDIPEYPYIVDKYLDYCLVYKRTNKKLDDEEKKKFHFNHLKSALMDILQIDENKIIIKSREKQKGSTQYEKLSNRQTTFTINEYQAKLEVNLFDYLDTGVFLDHRPMRQNIYKESENKSVLNLFSYTGTVSVFAALGNAKEVTSVDMSSTYQSWAERNFKLNNIPLSKHKFITQNALEYLKTARTSNKFDLIFLDPPTFSNSKKMEDIFDVERDQLFLIDKCLELLNNDGILYFSNNKRDFKLLEEIKEKYHCTEITSKTIPEDFRDSKIHCCYKIKHRS